MAEDKKKKMAVFAQEKNSFIGEIPKEGKNGKKKKSVAYQPRDADTTSGQNVQRSESTVKYQKTDTSGQNVQKSEGAEAGDKSGSDFIQRKQKKNIPAMITAAGTPIISRRRKAGIKGGNIKAGKRQKPLILSRISRQRTPHLPKRQNRNFKAVKS